MGNEPKGWGIKMMGIHVANFAQNKIYFVIDPSNPRETGAIQYPTGTFSYVNFWGWVFANPEIEKLEQNEFQQLIWDEPLPQDEEMWESVFFTRETSLSGIIDQSLLVNLGGSNKTKKEGSKREDLARQVMEKGAQNE